MVFFLLGRAVVFFRRILLCLIEKSTQIKSSKKELVGKSFLIVLKMSFNLGCLRTFIVCLVVNVVILYMSHILS